MLTWASKMLLAARARAARAAESSAIEHGPVGREPGAAESQLGSCVAPALAAIRRALHQNLQHRGRSDGEEILQLWHPEQPRTNTQRSAARAGLPRKPDV